MQFTEVKTLLSGERIEYPCSLLEQTPDRLVLSYSISMAERIAELDLPAGSTSYGYYWPQHPYNVYHWMDPDGKTLGFYVNLSGPVFIGEDYVEWTDLVIDVLILPDPTLGYRVQVLDEDEVPDDIDGSLKLHLVSALHEVMHSWPALVRSVAAHSSRLREQALRRRNGRR
jgi:protein associated with RNAse G/E